MVLGCIAKEMALVGMDHGFQTLQQQGLETSLLMDNK
jgi:hypothetical protein